MNVARKIWKSLKRNPVVIAFAVAVASQVFQDWQNNKIDFSHFMGYLVMVFISVAVREFTVPKKEHEEIVEKVFQSGVEVGGKGD